MSTNKVVLKPAAPPRRTPQGPRVNINVPDDVRRAWKHEAIERDKTMSDMIVEAMALYLAKPAKRTRK